MTSTGQDRTVAALRAKLSGRGLIMTWFTIGSVPLVEMATQQGGDLALIDAQHGLWDRSALYGAVRASAVPVMIRAADHSNLHIGAALDSGAIGVLAPSVVNAEQAEAVVTAARYPPVGERSGGGVHALGVGFERYYAQAKDPLIGVMIEAVEGVTNAAAIAAVAGVDFVFIGTGDLSFSIGCFPEVDHRLEDACQAVLAACRAQGKPCGILTHSHEAAQQRRAEGFAVVVAAHDIGIVKSGFHRANQALARRAN